jgi:hypothetical protein
MTHLDHVHQKSFEITFNNVNPELINTIMGTYITPITPPNKLSRDEVADILEKAADLYQAEQVEWCTNKWITTKAGRVTVCAGGAIALAAGVNVTTFYGAYGSGDILETSLSRGEMAMDPNYEKFREVIDRTSAYLGDPVPSWNDNRLTPRSKSDVIDMFRRAAKDIRDDIERES